MKEKLHFVLVFLLVPILAQAHGMQMSNGEAFFLLGVFVMPFVYIFSLFFCFRLETQAETTGTTILTKIIASILFGIDTLAAIIVSSYFIYCFFYGFFDPEFTWFDLGGVGLYIFCIVAVVAFAWFLPYRAYMKGIKGVQPNKSDVGN